MAGTLYAENESKRQVRQKLNDDDKDFRSIAWELIHFRCFEPAKVKSN